MGEDNKLTWRKAWDFLWNSNSIWSWIINIVLAFVLIKFILYPGVGLLLGTELPIVAVISSSMEHPGGENWLKDGALCSTGMCSQEDWYLQKGITAEDFESFPFKWGFNKGDIMIIAGRSSEKIKVGDVIVFQSEKNYPIIHRVVRVYEERGEIFFETKGDNNPGQIKDFQLDEKEIPSDSVYGAAVIRIPYIGYVKILATELIGGS